jgi:TonB family protein
MRALLSMAVVCGCLAGGAAAQPLMNAPVRVGGNIKPPLKIRDVKAVYPEIAQSARVMGVVILEITVGTDGAVTGARVLRGVPLLNDSALEAVKQWLYEPTLLNGVPVPVIMTVTVAFTLQGQPAAGRADGIATVPGPASGTSETIGAGAARAPSAAANVNPFLVTPERVGLIWVGMTQPALLRAVPATQIRAIPRRTPRGLTTDLEIALEPGGPTALVAQIEGATVLQIEVRSDRFRTAEGLGIGTTLGELRRRDPGVRVVMCDRGPCAVMSSRVYTFELDTPAASAADLTQISDSATATSILVSRPVMPPPSPAPPVPQE